MLSSTYELTAILDLPISIIYDYLKYGIEKEKEKIAWDLWTSLYPFMVIGYVKFKPFEKFKKDLFKPQPKYSNKTLKEIQNEMIKVIAAYESR